MSPSRSLPLGGLLEPRQGKRGQLLAHNIVPAPFVRGPGRAEPGSGGGDYFGNAVPEGPGLGNERAGARAASPGRPAQARPR